jgi:hypothetical protein
MTLKSAAPCVKATSHSSTARPQEKESEIRFHSAKLVVPGLVPGNPRLTSSKCNNDVDGRHEPGYDEKMD